MNNKRKYIIYCRKSQDSRDRQVLSIESQIRELREFALKEKLDIVDILEESQSAYKPGRPIFNEMISKIKQGLANSILTWKPDRLARNAMDGGQVIQGMDDGFLHEIRTPYECFKKEDNRMMLYIHFGMSNDLSRQISANVLRGNRQKYARGEFVGKAPLGYLNAKIGLSRNIVLDPEKASLVKHLFKELAMGNYSVMDMVRKAEEWGLTGAYGNKIAKSGMYTLLQRTAYYGVFHHAGEYHQGSYEPLITKQLFDKAQEALRARSKPKKQTWFHAYKGLIKCDECGCVITAETKRKYYKRTDRHASYTYYHCTKRKRSCSQGSVTEAKLEEMLANMVMNISIDREVWDLGVKLLRKKYEAESKQQDKIRQAWQKRYNQVSDKMGKLLDLRLSGEISKEEYSEAKKGLLDSRAQLKEKLDDEHSGSLQWLELAEKFFNNCYQAREIMESDDLKVKRKLIQTVGSNLILSNRELKFSLKKPYDILLKPHIRSDVQARKDSNPQSHFWRVVVCQLTDGPKVSYILD